MIQSEAIKLKVAAIESLNPSLKKLTLVSIDGKDLPITSPGAHLIVELPLEKKILRNSYSIITPIEDRNKYEIIVRKSDSSRGGSVYIHEKLKEGDEINAVAPISVFAPQNRATKHLLIGAGIGITPLLSNLKALRKRGAIYEFHQIGKADELPVFETILGDLFDYRTQFHGGRNGLNIDEILSSQPLGTHLYFCGPQAFNDMMIEKAHENGWPKTSVHYESFGSAGGVPFDIKIASTGAIIHVDEHETMLEALERSQIDVPSLCRGGACGFCRCEVKEGELEHRDHYLSDEEKAENKSIMPCVSRGKSALVTLEL